MFGVSEACEVTIRSACWATTTSVVVVGRRALVKVKTRSKERKEVVEEEGLGVVVVVRVKKVLFHDAALRVHSGTSDASPRGPEQFLLRQEGASGSNNNNYINNKDDDAQGNGIIVNTRTTTELTTAAKCIL